LIRLSRAELTNSTLAYHDLSETAAIQDADSLTNGQNIAFVWPEWDVKADKIRIDSTDLEYMTADAPVTPGSFNSEAIAISRLTLNLEDVSFQDRKATANLREFHFSEGSGFELSKFQFELELDDKSTQISDLVLQTNRSNLAASTTLNYGSIDELINSPDKTKVKLAVEDTKLDVRDAYFFSPELARDTLIQEIARAPVFLKAELDGDLEHIDLGNLIASWSKTRLVASGTIEQPMDRERLRIDLPTILMMSTRSDLIRFVDEQSMGIQLPEALNLRSTVRGSLDDLVANLDLKTTLGNINLDGGFQNRETIAFDAELRVQDLQLGALLRMPELDTASFQIRATGSGTDIYSLNAELSSAFDRLNLYGGDYSGLNLEGKLVEGAGDVRMWITEEFLDFDLLTKLDLDSINSKIDLNLDLKGADFRELGLTGETSRAKLKLLANFEGNPEA